MKLRIILFFVFAVAVFSAEHVDSQVLSLIQRRSDLIKLIDIDGNGEVEITKETDALIALHNEYKQINKELAGLTTSEGKIFPSEPLEVKPYVMPVYVDFNDAGMVAAYNWYMIDGKSLGIDYLQAFNWPNLAADQGNEKAKESPYTLAELMVPLQIAETRQLISELHPNKQEQSNFIK